MTERQTVNVSREGAIAVFEIDNVSQRQISLLLIYLSSQIFQQFFSIYPWVTCQLKWFCCSPSF